MGTREAQARGQLAEGELGVPAAEPGRHRSGQVRVAAAGQERGVDPIEGGHSAEDLVRVEPGEQARLGKGRVPDRRAGKSAQALEEPPRAQDPAAEGLLERPRRRLGYTRLDECAVGQARSLTGSSDAPTCFGPFGNAPPKPSYPLLSYGPCCTDRDARLFEIFERFQRGLESIGRQLDPTANLVATQRLAHDLRHVDAQRQGALTIKMMRAIEEH